MDTTLLGTNLLQMPISIDISTWIPRIYDDHCNSIMICQIFHCPQINLPLPLREKIKVTRFNMSERGTKPINRKTWPWKQHIGAWPSQNRQCYLNSLCATSCDINIIRLQLVREIAGQILCNCPAWESNMHENLISTRNLKQKANHDVYVSLLVKILPLYIKF